MNFRTVFSTLCIAVLAIIVCGCVSVEGPAMQLQISPGFVPKKAYNYSHEQMWDKVLLTLRKERIMVASPNKESGIITTDYIAGWSIDVAAAFKDVYRYQYQIAFEKIAPSQTRLDIICKIERKRMEKGGSAKEAIDQLKQYEDVTYEMKKQADNLEVWLYEQIERSL